MSESSKVLEESGTRSTSCSLNVCPRAADTRVLLDTHLPIPKQNPKNSTVNDGRGSCGTLEFRARDLQVCLCRDCSDRAPRLADSRRVCFEYAARPFRHTSSDLGSAYGRPLTPFPCFPVLPGSGLVSGLQKCSVVAHVARISVVARCWRLNPLRNLRQATGKNLP